MTEAATHATQELQQIRKIKKEPISQKQMAKERDMDHEMVRGIFHFHEVPGGEMTFVFKKYKGDKILQYTLRDGGVYTLPLMVAKHLNKNCFYPVHDYLMDEHQKFTNQYRIQKKVRRCSFRSLEFVDTADLTPVGEATIYTAERVGSF